MKNLLYRKTVDAMQRYLFRHRAIAAQFGAMVRLYTRVFGVKTIQRRWRCHMLRKVVWAEKKLKLFFLERLSWGVEIKRKRCVRENTRMRREEELVMKVVVRTCVDF
jgi:hypothetical protein